MPLQLWKKPQNVISSLIFPLQVFVLVVYAISKNVATGLFRQSR